MTKNRLGLFFKNEISDIAFQDKMYDLVYVHDDFEHADVIQVTRGYQQRPSRPGEINVVGQTVKLYRTVPWHVDGYCEVKFDRKTVLNHEVLRDLTQVRIKGLLGNVPQAIAIAFDNEEGENE